MFVWAISVRGLKVGNRWTVTRGDLTAFRETKSAAPVRPGGVDAAGSMISVAVWAQRYEARLVAGDSGGCWALIEAALGAGHDIQTIYLGVIQPALYGIGERWQRGEIGVEIEHAASILAQRHVARLSPRFNHRGTSRGSVLLGCAPGEQHSLGLVIAADLLRRRGFDARELGADVPIGAFVAAAASTERLVAVGIGWTTPGLQEQLSNLIAALRLVTKVPVVLGGQGVDATAARAMGADFFLGDVPDFVNFLEGLDSSTDGSVPSGEATPNVG